MWQHWAHYVFQLMAIFWIVLIGTTISSEDSKGNITEKSMNSRDFLWLSALPATLLYLASWLFI